MKPVTYLKKDDSTGLYYECDKEYGFPVYTHPVKELTDEEIEKLAEQYLSAHAQFIGAGECHYEGEINFARAILRKASEK